MTQRILDAPNPKQRAFFLAHSRFVAYGGSRGGGKSWAVRRKAMLMGVRWPGIRMLLLRRSYPELRENHLIPLLRELEGIAKYREGEKSFVFDNGSRLRFGYCDAEADTLRYQGQEFDVIFIDEATQLTEFQFETLTACLRGANDFPKRIYLTCNPGGVGHEWVKRRFIDRQFREGERPEDYTFIPARVYDNKVLLTHDAGYVRMLEGLPADLRRAWLDGDWNVFAGQYFREWDERVHVIEPFTIPAGWRRYVTIDYGLDMLAAYWVAVDEAGYAVVYRELYRSGVIISDAARMLRECSDGEAIEAFLAPPDLWNRRQETGRSAAEIFAENGVELEKTGNDRIDGWMAMKEYLKVPDTQDVPGGRDVPDMQEAPGAWGVPGRQEAWLDAAGGRGVPKLRVFRSCVNLIRTIPALQFDQRRPNDVANEPHEITHAPDAIRGFCIYRTQAADGARPADGEHGALGRWFALDPPGCGTGREPSGVI